MSIGIGAVANKIYEDENSVTYEYGGFNYNEIDYRNENHIYDGNITVMKNCFVEPENHEKLKKLPSGKKKLLIKRIPRSFDYVSMICNGEIKVKNCSNCWETKGEQEIDVVVLQLLFKLFMDYQESGEIPERIDYYK